MDGSGNMLKCMLTPRFFDIISDLLDKILRDIRANIMSVANKVTKNDTRYSDHNESRIQGSSNGPGLNEMKGKILGDMRNSRGDLNGKKKKDQEFYVTEGNERFCLTF